MNLPPSSFLIKLSGLLLVMLFTSQNAHALNLDINNIDTKKTNSKLSYDNLISKLPTIFVFQERDTAYLIKEIKNRYLMILYYNYLLQNLKDIIQPHYLDGQLI